MVSSRDVIVLQSLFGDKVQNFSQAFNRLNKGKSWLSGGQPPSALMTSSFLEGAEIIPSSLWFYPVTHSFIPYYAC